MSRRITLRNEDHEWMIGIVEGMIRKANQNAGVWLDHMPQLERVKNALYTAAQGFEELFPEEPPAAWEWQPPAVTTAAQQKAANEKVDAVTLDGTKKPRAKRGERLATLPNLCPDHPAYAGVKAKRTECEKCWEVYGRFHDAGEVARARQKMERKGRAEGET